MLFLYLKYFYKISLKFFNLGIFCVLILKKKININSSGIILKRKFKKNIKRILLGNFLNKSIILINYNLYSNNIKKIYINKKYITKTKRYNLYHKIKILNLILK